MVNHKLFFKSAFSSLGNNFLIFIISNSRRYQYKFSGSLEIVQRLQVHSSSICSVCTMDPYLISVGGKSEIFIWLLEAGTFHFVFICLIIYQIKWKHYFAGKLQQLFYIRMKGSYRLLSVRFISVNPQIRFLVSCSDGRFM